MTRGDYGGVEGSVRCEEMKLDDFFDFFLVGLEQIGAIIPLFGDGSWSVELGCSIVGLAG